MDQSIGAQEQPRFIKLNARDNVAIVVNDFGLPKGSRFACGLTLRAFVPQGHKTALTDIAEGAPIIRYGEVIGHALSPILAGEWVDEARIRMPDAPPLDQLEISTAVPPALPPLEGFTFEGFRNPDGSVGTKNILGISSSVQCVKGTMEYAVKRIRAELLPKYPNVDDVVPLTHAYAAASRSRRPMPWCRSEPCKTSRSIRISAARSSSSASAARNLRRNGWCRRASVMPSCGCRTKPSTASARSSMPS